ncbi:MAG: asparagine synthase (glutamine-hydrolyzing) [Deltaproteobacteria bacterium]
MCGIAGVYGVADEAAAGRMIDAQIHRGPDDRGIWSDREIPVTLGHCRLSIIDTSPAGHQPMPYADGRLRITYNGEIYNFKELRVELEGYGYRFTSNSDTEVILAAYCQWGPRCVQRFRGMFAFALTDRQPPSGGPVFVLARDRLGIKPLIYFEHKDEIWFASELRGLMASGCLDRRMDAEALLDYLAVGAVFQPRTIIAGASTLPAGHWLEIRGRERRLVKYWDLHEETAGLREELRNISFGEASERLRLLLKEAARYNLVSDVPVGAFLSGGIDSTAVVGLMSRASGSRIKTFSVGFDKAHRAMDERAFARVAADYLGSEHEEVIIATGDAEQIFSSVIKDIDQPSIDGTNTWIVSLAARHSVKVAVSGLGGDELFAGYAHFRLLAKDTRLAPNRFPIVYNVLERIHSLRSNFITESLLFKFATSAQRLSMLRRILSDFEFESAVLPEWRESFRERLAGRQERFLRTDADKVQQTSYAEISGYLLSTLLRDGDVMSMAHSLEIRPMLLDHPLVEFAYALPAACKMDEKQTKRVFIEAVSEYIPAELKTRPKMGFELPFIGWMAGDLQPRFEALLNSEAARKIFQPSYLRGLNRALRQGKPPRALWAWGVLLSWLEQHQIRLN